MTVPFDRWMLMAALLVGTSVAEEVPIISRVADIRVLPRDEAAKRLPVRLRGVVMWQFVYGGGFIVHDGGDGIYVDMSMAERYGIFTQGGMKPTDLTPGSVIELEGVTDSGGYAPVILPRDLRRVGSAALPEAKRYSTERLLSGNLDCQRVEVEGVVQKVSEPEEIGVRVFTLNVDGHACEVLVQYGLELSSETLLDARVRVRGLLVPKPNLRAEMTQLKMHAMGAGDVDVLIPAREPFAGPRVALNRLLPFSPEGAPYHRKVTQGVVTFALAGKFFFIQEGGAGVRVRYTGEPPRLGDAVEVAGFVEISRTLASLDGAVFRTLRSAAMPEAAPVKPDQIVFPQYRAPWELVAEKDFSGRLVRVRGRVIRGNRDGEVGDLIATAAGQTFSVVLPPMSGADLREGTELEFTGVCELEFTENAALTLPVSIAGFRLWARSPEDFKLLKAPPWWTPWRINAALVATGILVAGALAWNLLLRNLLKRRTVRLEEVMRAHRDVELEFSSAQRERMRLAGDLHDGIKQRLAAASFRVEAAAGHLPSSPETAASQLEVAHRTLLRTQVELEECLWGLHAVAEGPPDFASLLNHVTVSAEHWPPGRVVIDSVGEPRHFSRNVAGSLLLLFQEAVNNALRHGAATRVEVTVIYGPLELELRITDNGGGFDPRSVPGSRAGHFGIDGMKQRMHWLRGSLAISRRDAGGMEILAKLPWHAIPATAEEAPV